MNQKHIPEGFRTITPYLTVEEAQGLIDFLRTTFDAEVMHSESRDDGSIVNAALRIGDSVVEVSDTVGDWQAVTAGIHIFVPDTDATYEKALDAGATSLYEPADMPYGERSAGITDPTGNKWYIATHLTGKYEV